MRLRCTDCGVALIHLRALRAVSLQIPLASLALAVGVIKPLKCIILVWCLALVCCVLTPVKWWPKPPPLPAAPPPPPHPAVALRSTLQFCAAQPGSNLTFVNGAVPAGDTIYVGVFARVRTWVSATAC